MCAGCRHDLSGWCRARNCGERGGPGTRPDRARQSGEALSDFDLKVRDGRRGRQLPHAARRDLRQRQDWGWPASGRRDQEPQSHRGDRKGGRAGAGRDRLARDLASRDGRHDGEYARSLHLHSRHRRRAAHWPPRQLRVHSHAFEGCDRLVQSGAHRNPRPDFPQAAPGFSSTRRAEPSGAGRLVMSKLAAEFFGTFVLVFAGTGAIVIDGVSGGTVTHVGVALTFGLVVLAMIYTVGDVSGAHLNPAVTLGFFAAGRCGLGMVAGYIASQCLGATAASLLVHYLFPQSETLGITLPAGNAWQSFVLEAVLTFILMWVILSVSTGAKEKGITAGIAIGAVIGLEAMFAGPISGASMNPARSLGPALISMHS